MSRCEGSRVKLADLKRTSWPQRIHYIERHVNLHARRFEI